MRAKLGVTSVIALIVSLTALGAPSLSDAAPEDDGLVIDGPASVGPGATLPKPVDLGTIEPLPPLPTTTTTTTQPPPPPSWVLPANTGTGRRVVYSKGRQRVWAVDSAGRVIKTHLVSGNIHWAKPQLGTYQVFSRSLYTYALSNPSIKWKYMVRFARGPSGDNIGFHEIPRYGDPNTGTPVQSISQLGTPLSGGCVRQAPWDATWMWNWAYLGTKVVVIW
jgi:hypothetical protein